MRHRELFLYENNVSCSDLCDSTCPYGCNSYSTIYPISAPPPPPPPPQELLRSATKQSQHLSSITIIILTLLASSFLLFALIIAKRCGGCNRLRPRQRQTGVATDERHDQFLDGNRSPIMDHPIWYINTIGLQSSIIRSIAVFRYKRGENLIDVTECSVCLNEFQNGETLRLLPKCNHAFHIACVDTWLRSHTNCPLCRALIVSNVTSTTPVASNHPNSSATTAQDSASREENSVINRELNNVNQTRNEAIELPLVPVDAHQAAEIADCRGDLERDDTSLLIARDLREFHGFNEEKYDILPLERSASDGYLSAKIVTCGSGGISKVECDESLVYPRQEEQQGIANHQGECSDFPRKNCSSSIGDFLHKRPVRMKRSSSYSGRSILLRQHSTPRSKLTLPL